jgi:hypothetical protein
MSLLLSNFYPLANAVLTTGNQNITGIKNFQAPVVLNRINTSNNPAGFFDRIEVGEKNLYSNGIPSLNWFNKILSGNWKFENRPTVGGLQVLLQGDVVDGGGTNIQNVVFTTGTQNIGGDKTFDNNLNINAQINLRASATNNSPTQIAVFTSDPASSTRNLVTRTPSQIRSDIGANNASNLTEGTLEKARLSTQVQNELTGPFFGNRPIRRIPSIDTNYNGTTISGFLNNLFFPYTNATLSLNNFPISTYGYDTINSVAFAGELNPKDDVINSISCLFSTTTLSGPSTPIISNNTYSISPVNFILSPPSPNTRIATTTQNFFTRIAGTRNGTAFTQDSSAIRLRFEPAYFYGISSNSNLGTNITGLTRVSPTGVGGSSNSLYPSFSLGGRPSQINGLQFTFNSLTPNGYIYFAYPDFQNGTDLINNWGFLATSAGIVDAVSFADYSSTYTNNTVTINFLTKSNLTYRIYRSPLITPVSLPTTFTLNFKYV